MAESHTSLVRRWLRPAGRGVVHLTAWLVLLAPGVVMAQSMTSFDHFRTSFPLTGAHERVSCETCHTGGVFEGTPSRCAICHDGSGLRSDGGKSVTHIRSTNECGDCHLLAAWAPSRIDHDAVLGSCGDCHNGIVASGKNPGHPPASNRCEECHRPTTWLNARFDHTGITATCFSCHNGVAATGKHATHPQTSDQCEDCHRTSSWLGARFNHAGVTAACFSCHNGIDASGKSPGHLQTSNTCEECHSPGSWLNIDFDHTGVVGSCSSCHNGMDATGMDAGHFITSRDCGECHLQNRWTPSTFTHVSAGYPGDHSGRLSCGRCHGGNSEAVTWRFPGYQPDCAGCHASDYKADEHKKVDSPRILYSVSELRDCSGACHQYDDSTFTTIDKFRPGEHRVRDNEF
jgi:hypothetical protein